MKKLVILALVAILLPSIAYAQVDDCSTENEGIKQGDPAMYVNPGLGIEYPEETIELVEGESYCQEYIVGNFWWSSTLCGATGDDCFDPPGNYDNQIYFKGALDTFAFVMTDLQGWTTSEAYGLDNTCWIFNDTCSYAECPGDFGWYIWSEFCITAPCPATVGTTNTLTLGFYYCDETMTVQPDSGDCEDPNWRGGGTVACYQEEYIDFIIVEPAPALVIFQDTLYLVEEGLAAAYVPFSLCNGDLCAGSGDYDYIITSVGHVGGAIYQTGTATAVAPGDCEDIFAIIDAGAATACDYDTLTIIGWDVATGLVYDTCVQAIHVVEPVPVPLFTAPVVTILVLAMILAAAVIMKRHAVSKV
jgi:hypothetical protein